MQCNLDGLHKGVVSFAWFMADHSDSIPAELREALGTINQTKPPDLERFVVRIQSQPRSKIVLLSRLILGISTTAHRKYFGSLTAPELCAFIRQVAFSGHSSLEDSHGDSDRRLLGVA